jgi:hypothetical protein
MVFGGNEFGCCSVNNIMCFLKLENAFVLYTSRAIFQTANLVRSLLWLLKLYGNNALKRLFGRKKEQVTEG